jgi:hypothetical protein
MGGISPGAPDATTPPDAASGRSRSRSTADRYSATAQREPKDPRDAETRGDVEDEEGLEREVEEVERAGGQDDGAHDRVSHDEAEPCQKSIARRACLGFDRCLRGPPDR